MGKHEVQLSSGIREIALGEMTQEYLMLMAGILGDFQCPVHGGSAANMGFQPGPDGKTIVLIDACCREMEEVLIERLKQAR